MKWYSKGEPYGEHIITLPFVRMTIATQKNVGGTYTKYIYLPGFTFIRDNRGCMLKLLGKIVYESEEKSDE